MTDAKDNIQLTAVEDHNGLLTIRGGGARRDWNGIHYKQGMSAKNVGTKNLSANIATIPPELANCVADYAERLVEQCVFGPEAPKLGNER